MSDMLPFGDIWMSRKPGYVRSASRAIGKGIREFPSRIVEYCDELAHKAPQVPVYVGMAGPTNARNLFHFARLCGVTESLRALSAPGIKAAKLACHTSPDEQVEVIARYRAGHELGNVIGLHVFSFGGVARAAEWMSGKF